MDIEDQSCGAAFVFGIVHHIPDWQKALNEIARVLEARGYCLIEEPEARFTSWLHLEQGLDKAGFELLEEPKKILFGSFKSYLYRKEITAPSQPRRASLTMNFPVPSVDKGVAAVRISREKRSECTFSLT